MAEFINDIQQAGFCDCLIHPFQNDPGVSQQQRVMNDLLGDTAKIDARTTADLLNYFYQLSSRINYYDSNLLVSDWQPFFQNSIPFSLASLIKYDAESAEEKFNFYNLLFEKNPSSSGLQLISFFIYYSIKKINDCYLKFKDSDLPIARSFENIIKDKLQQPLLDFIVLNWLASKWFCVKQINFSSFDEVWNIPSIQILIKKIEEEDNAFVVLGENARLIELHRKITDLFSSFFEATKILSQIAEDSLEQSLFPLKDDLQKKHEPHLALIFAFLKLFENLQSDLNSFTKKHLDFFYKQVLQLKPKDAVPDKAHIVFEIQKELKNYLLKKDLELKDGKDINKQEILFALDDEIVVTKTQIADTRTLYSNNEIIPNPTGGGTNVALLEGVYMAPNAIKADGIDKDFQTDVKNFYTVGNKESKYILPGTNVFKPYPNARLGFILASPVLLLNEGKRTVTITLDCKLDEQICEELANLKYPPSKKCCQEGSSFINDEDISYPQFLSSAELFPSFLNDLQTSLNTEYYYVSEELISDAVKQGISNDIAIALRDYLMESNKVNDPTLPKPYCYCPIEKKKFDTIVDASTFETDFSSSIDLITQFFKKRKPLKLLFSGEKEWIEPNKDNPITFTVSGSSTEFMLTITAVLTPELKAVTFYNKDNLKEDLGATLPLVKIELDDKFKINFTLPDLNDEDKCCLEREISDKSLPVSLYHFFRNIKVESNTKIDVKVCGLKNFIVQNDESVMDVNGPIYPFGARPKVEANFYIGCEEIFLKKWNDIIVDINWKDIPPLSTLAPPLGGTRFRAYYNGYQDFFVSTGVESNFIQDDKFRMQIAILQDGNWIQWQYNEDCNHSGDAKCQLFQLMPASALCTSDINYAYQYQINRINDFNPDLPFPSEKIELKGIKKYDVNSRQSFIRITLKCQDFLHDKYSFILARQMSALGKLPELIAGAVYFNIPPGGSYQVLDLNEVFKNVTNSSTLSNATNPKVSFIQDEALGGDTDSNKVTNISNKVNEDIDANFLPPPSPNPQHFDTLKDAESALNNILTINNNIVTNFGDSGVVIPNQPWTPIISAIGLDYTATATITDIELIHLYPFAGTYKEEEIELEPTLFPTFCDEGTLFLGLENLVPGNNLNILFQLAEATGDSESDKENIYWHYLDSNIWKPLRKGFEVIDDATKNLTTSGIIKFSLPENMTSDNTIMPANLFWIKATIPQNSKSVSETTAIFTQAILTTFTNDDANDKSRLNTPLAAGQISKLVVADASVKSITQPFDSFNGQVPENEGMFYVRVSEMLRHKNRAIQKFDYERIALDAFPQIFKAKCINHSFGLNAHLYKNDFPYAPGYVLLAVIPDLLKLKAGNAFEPKVPISILEEIDEYIRKKTSPFVRFRSMNPRYEKIHFCFKVKLVFGKNENYYKEKLKEDIREFLAPWAIGDFSKLSFGQCVSRSVIIGFLDQLDYIDFIAYLNIRHETDATFETDESKIPVQICPKTPRSILIAGDIDVCVSDDCDDWEYCYDNSFNNENRKLRIACCDKQEKIIDYCKPTNE